MQQCNKTKMTWIRTDCYTPTSSSPTLRRRVEESGQEESSSFVEVFSNDESTCSQPPPVRCCPLHKHIRNKAWSAVTAYMREHPSDISHQNRVGWSSLVLAIYHDAPTEIIAHMLAHAEERNKLLSTPVPNGARLALHFAARFSKDLEIFKLLVEAYPLALAVPSTDGNRPLDRAIYYRKEVKILKYLQDETKQQVLLINNEQLRQIVLECCGNCWSTILRNNSGNWHHWQQQQVPRLKDEDLQFVLQFYGYTKEREMDSLFRNVLSYVGIPQGRSMSNYP